tara:strand:+ start:99 stop:296 length:198 start_codon:yes stop_codon:yes gene_type:complete
MQKYKNAQWVAVKSHDGKTILDPKDNIKVEIDGVIRQVPTDLSNRHYVEILEQVEQGKLTIKDAE